jgi:hypothetical protein
MKKSTNAPRPAVFILLFIIAAGFTFGLGMLKTHGIINVPWWVVTAPVWCIPVITLLVGLAILALLTPDIVATFRSERAYRRSIREKVARFLSGRKT